jgi:energy-coupling factor transporter transmembrane protein EcfT
VERLQVNNPLYPLLCLAFSTIVLVGGLLVSREIALAYVLAALLLIYPCFGYGMVMLRCLVPGLIIALVIGTLTFFISGSDVKALQMAGRILLLMLCTVPVISLPPVYLTRSLTQIGCPRALLLGMLVTVRFVPLLLGEMQRIREAMKTRGVRLTLNPSYAYRAFLIPLIMRLVGISELLSLSVETRGFDLASTEATVYRPVVFTVRDGMFAALIVALVVVMMVVR